MSFLHVGDGVMESSFPGQVTLVEHSLHVPKVVVTDKKTSLTTERPGDPCKTHSAHGIFSRVKPIHTGRFLNLQGWRYCVVPTYLAILLGVLHEEPQSFSPEISVKGRRFECSRESVLFYVPTKQFCGSVGRDTRRPRRKYAYRRGTCKSDTFSGTLLPPPVVPQPPNFDDAERVPRFSLAMVDLIHFLSFNRLLTKALWCARRRCVMASCLWITL